MLIPKMMIYRRKVSQVMIAVLIVCIVIYVLLPVYLLKKMNNFEMYKLTEERSFYHLYPLLKNNTSISMMSCKEKTNFVFIKCMKCATETLGTVFRRFGYVRNLTFVTPVGKKLYLGWPFQMTKSDYRPSKRPFNIIMEHSIYNKTVMEALMPADTLYITIIREPYSHFKSVFTYFNLKNIAKVSSNDPFTEYLHHIGKYEQIYQRHEASSTRYCIPDNFSMTKNLLSHCIGMSLGFPAGTQNITSDADAVERYIQQIDKDFSLVMIVEYFHESLILFKRIMCWTFKDIIYWNANVANYVKKFDPHSDENVKIYQKWSSVDYKLYDHFNKTLWKRIHAQTPDFFSEVQYFTTVQENVVKFCLKPDLKKLVFNKTVWHEQFEFSTEGCKMLKQKLLEAIQKRHDEQDHNSVPPTRKPGDRYVPLC
ncbi:galactose-3-O-sulfotransferase 2-like [Gigantopelta aegis]|uniref:galactose-3-O-sulfotransferase 2-like n=1 Tax=Gigantopelta aegis TaxID=1735272 RepID=UPI001B88A24B|nr:galactose-3-O-sulfotransferase 2-like [Gigantopelta aegis]